MKNIIKISGTKPHKETKSKIKLRMRKINSLIHFLEKDAREVADKLKKTATNSTFYKSMRKHYSSRY